METQHIPAIFSNDKDGTSYARLAATAFPSRRPDTPRCCTATLCIEGCAVGRRGAVVRRRRARRWRHQARRLCHATVQGERRLKLEFLPARVPRKQAASLTWKSFATSITPDPLTLGFRWNEELTRQRGALVTLPEFFRLGKQGEKQRWSVVSAKDVPEELGLTQYRFETPKEEPQEPRTTPDAPESSWKKPGPKAGPFKARLGDGSAVTYYWYRFTDQPAMLNADLTPAEREVVQKRVEKLHRSWTKDRDYLAPPDFGKLAEIDPALIVTPPPGLEVGYVPIATRQELETKP